LQFLAVLFSASLTMRLSYKLVPGIQDVQALGIQDELVVQALGIQDELVLQALGIQVQLARESYY